MTASFTGFPQQALTFFRQLRKNNSREWFTPRKSVFEEQVKGPMAALVELLNEDLRSFAVDHVTEPKRAIYRLYRDTRFSNDKTPYKTHIGALFGHAKLPRNAGANYYVGVSDEGVEIAGGTYMPDAVELAAVRRAIVEREAAFRKLLDDRKLRKIMGALAGDKLARVPKGFAADHP